MIKGKSRIVISVFGGYEKLKSMSFIIIFVRRLLVVTKKSWKQQHSIPQTDSTFKRVVWLGELTMLTPHFSLRG